MFLNQLEIGPASKAREIVELDHRTAAIFDRYGIRYCCGLQRPLDEVCAVSGTDLGAVLADLHRVSRTISLSPETSYDTWSVDFMIDYISNIHHAYLFTNLPLVSDALYGFVLEHKNKYPSFAEL